MSAGNDERGYGWVAKGFHWLIALLILASLALGLYAASLRDSQAQELQKVFEAFSVHKTLGVSVLILGVLRVLWMLTQPKPRPLHPQRRVETYVADLVHWALYLGMIIMPLSGWLVHSSAPGGFARILWPFGQRLPAVPQDPALSERFAAFHGIGWWVLAALIVLHVGGAMKHLVIDRDQTLARMTHGRNLEEPPKDSRFTKLTGIAGAVLLWAAVLVAATLAPREADPLFDETPAASQPEATAPAPATSAEAAQETASTGAPVWQVQDGTLGISVTQGGNPVTGQFADWNANIDYDPDTQTGKVDVTINTGSLTLGSVSDTAKGPDFLNTTQFPEARFQADLLPPEAEGQPHLAKGTLTILGKTVDAELPFTLTIEGDSAKADGKMSVNRQDFGVGATYADETTVGFAVDIEFALNAKRL